MSLIQTARLDLVQMTLPIVEAVLAANVSELARIADAVVPSGWPSREQIHRAYHSVEGIRANPEARLWGDRLVIARDGPRRIVGSVMFRGRPGVDGVAEVAYGIEPQSQRQGFAVEATHASIAWALAQPSVQAIQAVTLPWHRASIRVLEKLGMRPVDRRENEVLGEMIVYELRSISGS